MGGAKWRGSSGCPLLVLVSAASGDCGGGALGLAGTSGDASLWLLLLGDRRGCDEDDDDDDVGVDPRPPR